MFTLYISHLVQEVLCSICYYEWSDECDKVRHIQWLSYKLKHMLLVSADKNCPSSKIKLPASTDIRKFT